MQISDLIARLAIDADYLDRFSGERTAIAEDIRDAIAALSLPVQPEPPEPFAYCCSSFDIDACDCVNKNHSTAIRSTGRTTTPPVQPTKGPEDDLIAARAAAKEAGGEHSYVAVQAALLALRSRPASALPVVGEDDERFLLAYVSRDTKIIGIEHPTEADWSEVLAAHVALRDRLNVRIAEQEKCPFNPSTPSVQP